MLSLWKMSIMSVCRQKRTFLLLLCTFGSSFLAFNYSLLSSTTTVLQQTLGGNEEERDGQQRHTEVAASYWLPSQKSQASFSKPEKERKSKVSYNELESMGSTSASIKSNLNRVHDADAVNKGVAVTDSGESYMSAALFGNERNNSGIVSGNRSNNDSYGNKTDTDVKVSFGESIVRTRVSRTNNVADYNTQTDSSIAFPLSSILMSSTSATSLDVGSNNTNSNKSNPTVSTNPFRIPACDNLPLRRVQKRKKNLTVIENFIMGWKRVKCNETITYTTHGDYRYLDNLVPLVERWNGPVSLALYAPGSDLEKTLSLVSYLKLCTSSKIDEWVTFHLIYDVKYTTRPVHDGKGDISWLHELYHRSKWTDCSLKPNFTKGDSTFRMQAGLLYPINIARNIARSAATTYFVLASDIELYPSTNLIPSFMKMFHRLETGARVFINPRNNTRFTAAAAAVAKILFPTLGNHSEVTTEPPLQYHDHLQSNHVFVLPVFEVKKDIRPCQVETKGQLVSLLRNFTAVLFHHSICPQCHTFPKFEEWKQHWDSRDLKILWKAKRQAPFQLWEPIFIGTKKEPIYDERLSWEGLRDKMVLGYIMCVLDYDFYILDNAFLVHKPGIRKVSHLVTKTVASQDRLINYRIRSELLRKFGKHDECAL